MTTKTNRSPHQLESDVEGMGTALEKMLLERDRLAAENAELRAALEASFIAMGRSGANAFLDHPARKEWESARAILARLDGAR